MLDDDLRHLGVYWGMKAPPPSPPWVEGGAGGGAEVVCLGCMG